MELQTALQFQEPRHRNFNVFWFNVSIRTFSIASIEAAATDLIVENPADINAAARRPCKYQKRKLPVKLMLSRSHNVTQAVALCGMRSTQSVQSVQCFLVWNPSICVAQHTHISTAIQQWKPAPAAIQFHGVPRLFAPFEKRQSSHQDGEIQHWAQAYRKRKYSRIMRDRMWQTRQRTTGAGHTRLQRLRSLNQHESATFEWDREGHWTWSIKSDKAT